MDCDKFFDRRNLTTAPFINEWAVPIASFYLLMFTFEMDFCDDCSSTSTSCSCGRCYKTFFYKTIKKLLCCTNLHKNEMWRGCRHTSVDSSAPSILPPIRLPSPPSTLLSFIVKFVLYLSMPCEQRTRINKKRPSLVHLKNEMWKQCYLCANVVYPKADYCF